MSLDPTQLSPSPSPPLSPPAIRTEAQPIGHFDVTRRAPLTFARGQGSWLYTESGEAYLDFMQGWAVNALGHGEHAASRAAADQATRLMTPSPLFMHSGLARLAPLLCARTGMDKAFFGCSGADANESAIKLARKWGARHRGGAFEVLSTVDGFHGSSLATMAATGKAAFRGLFAPEMRGFQHVPYGDIDALAAAITPNACAVLLEPIQGEAGVVLPPPGYLQAVRALTRERGVLLILDEVQTGMGRTGKLLACEQASVRPDILTLGKGLGAGVPISAMLATDAVDVLEPGDLGGTFQAHGLGVAAALAMLDTLDGAFLERVAQAGQRLREGLRALVEPRGGSVRGQGLLLAAVLPPDCSASAIARAALERQLLINAAREDVLRFMPALNVSDGEIDEALGRLESALGSALPPRA